MTGHKHIYISYNLWYNSKIMTRRLEVLQLYREIVDPKGTLPEVTLQQSYDGLRETSFGMYAQSRKIGRASISAMGTSYPGTIQYMGIDEDMQGWGYGCSAYLEVAALVEDNGHTLRSDMTMSPDAVRVWGSLVSKGVATVISVPKWDNRTYSYEGRFAFLPYDELRDSRSPVVSMVAASRDGMWDF